MEGRLLGRVAHVGTLGGVVKHLLSGELEMSKKKKNT